MALSFAVPPQDFKCPIWLPPWKISGGTTGYFIFLIKWEIVLKYHHPVQLANWPFKSRWGYSPDVYQTNPAVQQIDKRITLTTSAVVSDQKAIYCEDEDAYLIIIWPCSVHRGLNLPWYGPRWDRILGTAASATNWGLWGKRYSTKLSVRNLELHRIYTFTDQRR